MTIHVDEMTTSVDAASAAAPASVATPRTDSPAEREAARRVAERAARIVRRTRSEHFDD